MNSRIKFIITKGLQKFALVIIIFLRENFFALYTKIRVQENDYHERKFLELFYANKCNLTINIKSNEYFFSLYEKN